MGKRIVFSFWNYVQSGVLGKEAVSDWKELGINVAMSFEYNPKTDKIQDMIDILDECAAQGIQLIICDKRTSYKTYEEMDYAQFEQGIREAVADFGGHSATYGFSVGDEPKRTQMEGVKTAIKLLKRFAPNLTPFINVYPYWATRDFCDATGAENREDYFYVIDDMIKDCQQPMIAYDHYGQCADYEDPETGIDTYFTNLNFFHELAERNQIPFWNTVLSVGHWVYRVPTEDDIRWQIYTSLAHGARGIMWFFFYMRYLHDNYRNSPFDARYKRTEMFNILARQAAIFEDNYADLFEYLTMEKVMHHNKAYGKTPLFMPDDVITEIKDRRGFPIIVTYYKGKDGEKWLSVVNGHQTLSNHIEVTLANGEKQSFWLAPGQMGLYKVGE